MKKWQNAITDFDEKAISYWLKVGWNPNSKILSRQDPEKKKTLPIAYCCQKLMRDCNAQRFRKILKAFILLVEAGSTIDFLHPSQSAFFSELIKETQCIYYNNTYHSTEGEQLAFEAIQFILNKQPEWINETDKNGNTLLHLTLQGGRLRLAMYLLNQGADPHKKNKQQDLPIHLICRAGPIQQALDHAKHKKDIGEKTDTKQKPEELFQAVVSRLITGHGDQLLQKNIEERCPLTEMKDPDRLLYLLSKIDLSTHEAAGTKTLNAIWGRFGYLPIKELPPYKRVLNYLAKQGFGTEKVLHLKNIIFNHIRHADRNQYDISVELIEYALELGIDINTTLPNGNTLLHTATSLLCSKHVTCMSLQRLLECKANPMIMNEQGRYFIEMLQWRPDPKRNKQKAQWIHACMRYYPKSFLPSNATHLFCLALESELYDFANALLDRGYKPPAFITSNERVHVESRLIQALPQKALVWAAQNEKCRSMFPLNEINDIFYNTVTKLKKYALALALLKKRPELLKPPRSGSHILHQIAAQGWGNTDNTKLFEFAQQCFSLGADLNELNDEGQSLLSSIKEKIMQHSPTNYVNYSYARIHHAYIIAYAAITKTRRPLLTYEELYYFIKATHEEKGFSFLISELIPIYPRSIILSMALQISIDEQNPDKLKNLLPQLNPGPVYVDIFEGETFIRYPVFLYAVERLNSKKTPLFRSQTQKEDYFNKINTILLLLIDHNQHEHTPLFALLHSLKHILSHSFEFFTELVEKLLTDLPSSLINIQLSLSSHSFLHGINLLQKAAGSGNSANVSALLSHKADISLGDVVNHTFSEPHQSTLLYACRKNHPETIRILLESKADPNEKVETIFPKCLSLSRVIHSYKEESKDASLSLLLTHKAQPKLNDMTGFYRDTSPYSQDTIQAFYESTPTRSKIEDHWLIRAISLSNVSLVKQILKEPEVEEFITARTTQGMQAIHVAAQHEQANIFQLILNAKASLNDRDYLGMTPITYAVMHETLENLGLQFKSHFNYDELHKFIRFCCNNEKEFYDHVESSMNLLRAYAYKLFSLFRTLDRVNAFINKYRDNNSHQPIHNLCQFELPHEKEGWHINKWADLMLEDHETWQSFLPWAVCIEKTNGEVPGNIAIARRIMERVRYLHQDKNPALARLFLLHKIPETAFNRALGMAWPKPDDKMPDIYIDGSQIKHPKFYFKKLDRSDIRGFVLGKITYCCQSIGSEGEGPASHGLTSAYGGFYALFKKEKDKDKIKHAKLLSLLSSANTLNDFLSSLKDKSQRRALRKEALAWQKSHPEENILSYFRLKFKDKLEDNIVAQCWAWISNNNELVFDSWEQLRDRPDITKVCLPFLHAAAQVLISEHGYNRVLLGESGETPKDLPLNLVSNRNHASPKDYYGYRDSVSGQYLLAQSDGNKQHTQSPLQATCMWRKTPKRYLGIYNNLKIERKIADLLKKQSMIDTFPSSLISDNTNKEFPLSRYVLQLKQSMDKSKGTERHAILPLMCDRRDFDLTRNTSDADYEAYEAEENEIHWMAIGMSIYHVPHSETPSFSLYLLNPMLYDRVLSWDLPVTTVQAHYVDQVHKTGPWMITMLENFITTKIWGGSLTQVEKGIAANAPARR